jgi:hypothetical protein
MTNQMSEKIARGPWDNPQNPQYNIRTPGGTAMEFEAHIRIHAQCRPILSKNKHPLTGKELLIGWEVCYRLVKNKFSKKTGNRVANSDFYFDPPGFRRATEIFNVAEFLGIIQRTGTSIYLIGKDKIRGRDAALEFLHSKPELCKKLEAEIIERAEEVFSDIEGEEDKVSAQF